MLSESQSLTIVLPIYNEHDNLVELIKRVHDALVSTGWRWELICVDDGSSDGSGALLMQLAGQYGPHVQVLRLSRNFGQTAAMQAGIDASRGTFIVTLDSDLQNDPHDIPRMVEQLISRELDLLVGWRKNRKDALLLRKIPSLIANKLIARVTGVNLHDYGCSLKVYRSDVLKRIRLFGEMHRFIPVWMASVTAPERIGEIVVNHAPRTRGESKYGISRTFRVILDLLAVFFFLRFRARPGHFFGAIGLIFGFFGAVIMAYLITLKFGFSQDIGNRPLFFIGILFLVASIQFLTTGVLAELLSRTFFESAKSPAYSLAPDCRPVAAWYQSDPQYTKQ